MTMTGDTLRVFDPPKDVKAAVQLHDLRDPTFVHDNLQSSDCRCRAQPSNDSVRLEAALSPFNANSDDACLTCGSTDMYRTGSCMTCHSCGATGGCA